MAGGFAQLDPARLHWRLLDAAGPLSESFDFSLLAQLEARQDFFLGSLSLGSHIEQCIGEGGCNDLTLLFLPRRETFFLTNKLTSKTSYSGFASSTLLVGSLAA